MTTNLVTGADGFVGQHLVSELLRRGEAVVGAVRESPPRLTTLTAGEAARVRWFSFDLQRRESVRALLRSHQPERIFHLAGLTSVAESLHDPVAAMRVNATGTLFLLDELVQACQRREAPLILISGSAHVYGAAAARFRPLTEECPLEPLTPYAASKVTQEVLGLQFYRAGGLPGVVTRSFNHTGPGQPPSFVAAQLAARIREIQRQGGSGTVRVGDPEVRRDFTDVRDVVRAYVALTEAGEPGRVYNVCSGRAYAVGAILEMLAEIAALAVQVEIDPERARRADIPEMLGSYDRLAAATGWGPEIDMRATLADLLSFQAA